MPRTSTVSDKVKSKVLAGARDRFWTSDDLKGAGDAIAIDRALARLVRDGELRRVRRGLYWRGRRTPFGMSRPSSSDVVSAVVGTRGVGPAGLSAANLIGVTTQVPAMDIVAVPTRVPRPVPQVRFVDRAARSGRLTANLGSSEVALLEVLGDWDRFVAPDDEGARRRVVGLVQSGSVNVNKLVRAAPQEPAVVRGRLRGLLDAAGEHQAALQVPPPRSPASLIPDLW